jgi:hypothetical protein
MEDLSSTITTPVAPAPRRGFGPAVLAATAVAALAVGFGAGWASHTSSSDSSSATTAVHGMLQLPDGGYTSVGNTCSGSGGYQDISAGVAVTIGDQTGKTLAVTSLQPGVFGGGGCQFTFSAKVASATAYTVTISHRGTQTFTPADVPGGFNMTLSAG